MARHNRLTVIWRSGSISKAASHQGLTPDMLKSELVRQLSEQNPHLYPRDLEKVVNAILDTISDALARGDRVELRGFGTFAVKKRGSRTGRNPRTGDMVHVSEKAVPVFKTGKEMHKRLNPTLPGGPARRGVANGAAVGSHIVV